MLYHHHEEEAGPGQTFIPEVYSRLPSVGILSEDTEAEVGEGGEVTTRDSWNLASPLPPHLEEPLCSEITEYVFPKAALSKHNQWRWIIRTISVCRLEIH